jgi:hypothetical protein
MDLAMATWLVMYTYSLEHLKQHRDHYARKLFIEAEDEDKALVEMMKYLKGEYFNVELSTVGNFKYALVTAPNALTFFFVREMTKLPL